MLSWINRRVGRKLAAGITLLALLMLALTGVGLWSVERVNREIRTETDRLAQALTLSREIATQTALVKTQADSYIRGGRQEDLNRFIDCLHVLEGRLAAFRQVVSEPARHGRLAEIDQAVQAYTGAFQQVIELIRRRQNLVHTRLSAAKYAVANQLSALRMAFSIDQSMNLFLLHDNAQDAFMAMIVNGTQYLQSGDERFAVLFDRAYQDATGAITDLAAHLDQRSEAAQAQAASQGVENYALAFNQLKMDSQSLAQLQERVLRGLETVITEGVARISGDLAGEFHANQARSRERLRDTRRNVLALAGLVLATGLAAGLIISRRITRALTAVMLTSKQIADRDLRCLIGQLDRLAAGDLEVDFKVGALPLESDLVDEVGEMARAFDAIVGQLIAARYAFEAMTAYLKRMAAATTEVADGRLEVAIEPAGPKDVLGQSARDMVAALRRAQAGVRRHREFLEQQVAERTAQLEQSRQALVILMSNLQGMAYRCLNDPDWTAEFVSDGALDLTGYGAEALTGNREVAYGSLIHPDDRAAVWDDVQQALDQRRPFVLLYRIRTRGGEEKWVWEKGRGVFDEAGGLLALEGFVTDITDRKRLEQDRERLIEQLQKALTEVRTLSGLLPICSSCKRIRDDQGYWQQIEGYLHDHSNLDFTHGICPECARRLYPDIDL